MIEGDHCQTESDFNAYQRTESSLRAPGPDDVVERLILILSSTQHTSSRLDNSANTGLMKGARSFGSLGVCLGGSSLSASARLNLHHVPDPDGKTGGCVDHHWIWCGGTWPRSLCAFHPCPQEICG